MIRLFKLVLAISLLLAVFGFSFTTGARTAHIGGTRSGATGGCNVPNKRPPPAQRLFHSDAVEDEIERVCSMIRDPTLASIFVNCYPNTLDTTVHYFNNSTTNPDTFIITGDIPAMWLRDSSAQVSSYLKLAQSDPNLRQLIRGLIFRQSKSVLLDPYANAFLLNTSAPSPWDSDKRTPPMKPGLWEGKYELDSLMSVLRLATQYFINTQDSSICASEDFLNAVAKIMDVVEYQSRSSSEMNSKDSLYYSFGRMTRNSIDTLFDNIGQPSKSCGLSRSPFRPSDDSHVLPFLVPANAMASVVLKDLSTLLSASSCSAPASNLATRALKLSGVIKAAVMKHGIVDIPSVGPVFAYEVDGFGGNYRMDDANVPSLLSLPFLNFISTSDPIYIRTRKFIMSDRNPYFFNGTAGSGIGSPHTGNGWIWPIAITMQALTSEDDNEIIECLRVLKRASESTGFQHESFWKDDVSKFTRAWFAWANSLFGELIVTLADTKPWILTSNIF